MDRLIIKRSFFYRTILDLLKKYRIGNRADALTAWAKALKN
jgi:hypothetical protein